MCLHSVRHTIGPGRLRIGFFPGIEAMCQHPNQRDFRQIVEQGYDCIAERYLEWNRGEQARDRVYYTALLMDRLPPGARVLDLGCGAGGWTTGQLIKRFAVTGVDISARSIVLARDRFPQAQFIQADMTKLDFPSDSFDAIAAFFSIIHVPRGEHAQLLCNIASWLRPGGLFVASMGTQPVEVGYEEDWLGVPMYWSSFDSEKNRQLVEGAGLCIVDAQEETVEEHGQPVTFLWVVAQKPTAFYRQKNSGEEG